MRIWLNKLKMNTKLGKALTDFKKMAEEHGAEYVESQCDTIDQLEAIFKISKKYGNLIMAGGVSFKDGLTSLGAINKTCQNYESISSPKLYPEELKWFIDTLYPFAVKWQTYLKKNNLSTYIRGNLSKIVKF